MQAHQADVDTGSVVYIFLRELGVVEEGVFSPVYVRPKCIHGMMYIHPAGTHVTCLIWRWLALHSVCVMICPEEVSACAALSRVAIGSRKQYLCDKLACSADSNGTCSNNLGQCPWFSFGMFSTANEKLTGGCKADTRTLLQQVQHMKRMSQLVGEPTVRGQRCGPWGTGRAVAGKSPGCCHHAAPTICPCHTTAVASPTSCSGCLLEPWPSSPDNHSKPALSTAQLVALSQWLCSPDSMPAS